MLKQIEGLHLVRPPSRDANSHQNDPICPLPQSLALIDWLASHNADVRTVVEPSGQEIGPMEFERLHEFMRESNL